MSYVHPFTVNTQIGLDDQYGDARVSSTSLPADEFAFIDAAHVWGRVPSDAEMLAMHLEDCRRNDEHAGQATVEDELSAFDCTPADGPKAPVHYIPWNIHLSSRPVSRPRIPARAALGL
jgi:hypothetical protein